MGRLAPPQLPEGASEEEVRVAEQARISGFREDSRGGRMRIAEEAQPAFRRTVSWGAECGGSRVLFTTAGVPVMTRLRLADRRVLDTLIDAGVARSRSEALAWTRPPGGPARSGLDSRAARRHDVRRGGPGPRAAGRRLGLTGSD